MNDVSWRRYVVSAPASPIRAIHHDLLVTQACHVAMLESALDAIVSIDAEGTIL